MLVTGPVRTVTNAKAEELRVRAVEALQLLDTPPEERFDRLARLAQRIFQVPTVLITLIDRDRQFHKARVGFELPEIPRSQSFCSHTIRTHEPFVVSDPVHHSDVRSNPLVTSASGIRFYAGQPLFAPGGEAVGALCLVDRRRRSITERELKILADLAGLVEVELARSAELDRAGDVQRNLLPGAPPTLPGYEVRGVCLPASEVGGDFYDWYLLKDGFQVVLADVMGKGMPAAIIAASVRAVLRGTSRFNDLETAVNRLAVALDDDLSHTSTFVTMLAGRLDLTTNRLAYIDAGHGIAGIVTAGGEALQFESDGMPLGVSTPATYRAASVQLEPGDTFVCLSDGLLDLFATVAEAREAIRQTIVNSASMTEVIDRVAAYSREHRATDDVTAIVISRSEAA
jgi:serine phosphatase RsbU (regulator of sigma subunit)